MRGKPDLTNILFRQQRITPADAGKTGVSEIKSHTNQDHPRGCGENGYIMITIKDKEGSPPRMRGKLFKVILPKMRERITPADAGKTEESGYRLQPIQDHPRGCGENYPAPSMSYPQTGSPPRMRGKLVTADFDAAMDGITPADAGKTRRMGTAQTNI